ncbi:MAG: hypothetical protein RLZZ115_3406 [Cyanobacteriota bacterium]
MVVKFIPPFFLIVFGGDKLLATSQIIGITIYLGLLDIFGFLNIRDFG